MGSQGNSESSRWRKSEIASSSAMEGHVGAPALADAGAKNLWQRMFGSDAGGSIFSADADGLQSEESSDGPPAAGADCCELTPSRRFIFRCSTS